jgi:hypothetical protein
MTKAEFREFYRKYNPDREFTDEELDKTFDAAADHLKGIDVNQITGIDVTDKEPEPQVSDVVKQAGRTLLGLLAYSTALRLSYVASATFWTNRVLKNAGRPERIRVRDAYMATIALRHLTRIMTEAAVGNARNENALLDRVQAAAESLKNLGTKETSNA